MNFFKKISIVTSIAAASFVGYTYGQDFQWKEATSNGYTYKYVTNDPTAARYYKLKNGLTVILSQEYKPILLQKQEAKQILPIIQVLRII